uniref:Defective in cullin neddylation protein n=1 Tax=Macrostomum lignano TaxID=282301 RepID=A0A1I8FDB4_9PLAT
MNRRSPFATYVFARAMAECGLLSQRCRDWLQYYDKHFHSSRRNLDKRAAWESGITDKFLEVIKQVYESEYLDKATKLCKIDLDRSTCQPILDTKLIHWRQAMFNTDQILQQKCFFQHQGPDDMPEGGLTMASKRVVTLLKRDPNARSGRC